MPFHHTAYTQSYDSYAVNSACKLSNVDKVQVLLLEQEGTFASMSNLTVSGKDFMISRTKNLAPML